MNVGTHGRIVCELSWDNSACMRPVDGDLQAVAIDQYGTVVDAAFFNNLKALGKGIVHSGDEASGKERVIVDLGSIPTDIKLIYIMAFVFTEGCYFTDVSCGAAKITHSAHPANAASIIGAFSITSIGQYTGAFLATLVREDRTNTFSIILLNRAVEMYGDRPPRHFLDCVSALHSEIVQYIPKAPAKLKVNFDMRKGAVFEFGALSQSVASVCLGWDIASRLPVDLDVSCVLFDAQQNLLETVFFGNLESSGGHSAVGAIRHSGDNRTGAGDGDDEIITVDLSRLGPLVSQIFFSINIYSRGASFQQVANPYCRVLFGKDEVCQYRLQESSTNTNGLIICRLLRTANSWGFQALGQPSQGAMWRDSIPDMLRLFHAKQQDIYSEEASLAHSQPSRKKHAAAEECCVTM